MKRALEQDTHLEIPEAPLSKTSRRFNAHVVLKDIEWQKVCDKTDKGVTNSELRAAY